MASKTLQSKVQAPFDTAANWQNSTRVLLYGEKIYAQTSNGSVRSKTGDGTKTFSQLPYDDEALYESLSNKVNRDEIGELGSTSINATLSASGWSSRMQTLSIDGVTPSANGIIGLAQTITDAEMESVEVGKLYVTGQGNGTITITAFGETPQRDIPVVVILIG